jgi:hypothetical protein
LFPQCCGELNDIIYWKHLAKYGREAYYHGHPAPRVTFTATEVVFDCREQDEGFQPDTLPEIIVCKQALSEAYDRALLELAAFAEHLRQVQQELGLRINDIDNLLIFRNPDLANELP